ncbi:MAG: hypothetical protein WCY97_00625 [Methanothrix sp.]|jgi:hypothetical protein|uniref:Uncharacterized protein n=1 Tax=Methanothrix harundinacea TaxID=301375 RepID=A0A124G3R1_9EURY|nr:MAG: hypothetical protein APR56_03020 [Methanosaeta sp. SDB]KUK45360.1 MAG: Uncharacterized protein XD72_0263 [Methanothrix harundinacea]MDD2638873.1 hypothetical protein [Methanothrix sp.]MDI9399648.1 hypothetical protein [Euryarchaeota archaeon]KUK97720.1 MAG: Uncharacterized protein XE07_0134 [Methanothrix harundinacea]
MAKKAALLVSALILIGAYALFFGGEDDFPSGGFCGRDMPDPYYLDLKPADVQNPDDVIRYSSSIKGYAEDLDVFERAAFYEWYFKSHGFDVSFAYAEKFADTENDHLWLLVRNRKGEVIEVDPSFSEVGGSSMVPLDRAYAVRDREFDDIYSAKEALGEDAVTWWRDEKACKVLNENVLVTEKERAQSMADA